MSIRLDDGYYLARDRGYPGQPWDIELIDGPHSDPLTVSDAALLHERIFDDYGPWKRVKVEEIE